MKYPEFYAKFGQWANIPIDQWEYFESLLVEKAILKNEFLVRSGDIALDYGMIVSGIFRLYYLDKNGKEQIKAFRVAGDLIGAYAEILLNIPSRTHIQAMENAFVLLINKNDFFSLYEKHSCWINLSRIVAEKHFLAKEQREFEFLQYGLLQRYQQFCEQYGALVGQIPQHQIASYLGVTPVALSRVLSKSRKKSAI